MRRSLAAFVVGCFAGGLVLTGCAAVGQPGPNRLPASRALVVARLSGDENRAVALAAADLLIRGLRDSGEVLGAREFVDEAGAVGLLTWAPSLVARLQHGAWPTRDERLLLGERFGIHTVILAEVTTYEQVWGKYAKFTRAAVEAQAFHIPSERVIWRVRGDAEVEDKRGRAFQIALEQAVASVVDGIHPRGLALSELWRGWRR